MRALGTSWTGIVSLLGAGIAGAGITLPGVAPVVPPAIAGPTGTATAAAAFEKAMTGTTGAGPTCSDEGNVVLATSADPTDALAAAYLEGQLRTGVLVTPPSTTGQIRPSVLAALRAGGVQRVYVVGGPDAVTPAELATLRATRAYICGGSATTGSDLQVIEAATTGATAPDTAGLIDGYPIGSDEGGAGLLPSLAPAYGSAATYDPVGGGASAAPPAVVSGTAIVVEAADWRDADAVAPLAYAYHLPVVLTSGTTLSPQAAAELARLGLDQVLAVGGPAALSPAVVSAIQAIHAQVGGTATPISVVRVAGEDASQTSADLARLEVAVLGWTARTVYVAQGGTSGSAWIDSAAAAPLSAASLGPVLLTAGPTQPVPASLTDLLSTAGSGPAGLGAGTTTTLQVLGGPDAVTPGQTSALVGALDAGTTGTGAGAGVGAGSAGTVGT